MESAKHMSLVQIALEFVKQQLDPNMHCFIEADLEGYIRPGKVGLGYIPDVYFSSNNYLFIGEAKTAADFDRRHSIMQYAAYMDELSHADRKSIFVIAVPWFVAPDATNYFRRMKRELDLRVTVAVLTEMGMHKEV